ncbi:MAG: hypothetical protein ACPHY8_06360 [Patescibacteria group bacterium]
MNLLEYALIALEFEIEKATGFLDIPEEKIDVIEHQLQEIDAKLFG